MSPKVESIICHFCDQIVLADSIFCDQCYTWIHFKCSNLNKKTFSLLSKSTDNWYCRKCFRNSVCENLPLSNVPDSYITTNTFNSCSKNPIENYICFACNKIINNWFSNSVLCSHGKHRLHLKCTNLNSTKLKSINQKFWSCSSCNNFPFSQIDNTSLSSLNNFNLLNSKYNINIINSPQIKDIFKSVKDLPKLEIDNSPPSNDSSIEEENTTSLDFDYYKIPDFVSLKSKLANSSSFFHTNIRSIKKNIAELSSLVHELDFDVISLTETWQNSNYTNNQCETLTGYHPFEFTMGQTQNSGCGLFIKEEISHSKRGDLSCSIYSSKCEFQSLFVEIHNSKSRNILVGVIYRHPSGNNLNDMEPFLAHINKILSTSKKEGKETIIMGDFNLDLLKLDSRPPVNMFLETMLTSFFHPHIIQPTHFSYENNLSLIDNIFYNSLDHRCTSGNYLVEINLLEHITDHLPNFFIIDKSISNSMKTKRFKRDFSNFNINNFTESLKEQNLERVLSTIGNDTNTMYNLFHDTLSDHFNEFTPLKQVSQKELRQLRKPWISNFIIKLIGTKNTLYSKFIQTGCRQTLKLYRSVRNDVNHKIRKSKYQYYKKIL